MKYATAKKRIPLITRIIAMTIPGMRPGLIIDKTNAIDAIFRKVEVNNNFMAIGGTGTTSVGGNLMSCIIGRNRLMSRIDEPMMFNTAMRRSITTVKIPGTIHENIPNAANIIPITISNHERLYCPIGVSPKAII